MFLVSRKMSARISELEDAAEQARSRAGKMEKERNRLQVEIHEVVTELEEVIALLHLYTIIKITSSSIVVVLFVDLYSALS